MTDRWLTTPEAAKLAGVSDYMLYRDVRRGRVSAYRIGRVIRYRYADVLAYRDKIHLITIPQREQETA